MHKIEIPQHILDRVMQRRGTLHCHADLNPRTTALIVVDLQNCFMVEEVASAYVPVAVEIVPAVNRLAAALRETGGKVFWVRNTVSEHAKESWSTWFEMMKLNPDQVNRRIKHMSIGARGHELSLGIREPLDHPLGRLLGIGCFVDCRGNYGKGDARIAQNLRASGRSRSENQFHGRGKLAARILHDARDNRLCPRAEWAAGPAMQAPFQSDRARRNELTAKNTKASATARETAMSQ